MIVMIFVKNVFILSDIVSNVDVLWHLGNLHIRDANPEKI